MDTVQHPEGSPGERVDSLRGLGGGSTEMWLKSTNILMVPLLCTESH